MTKPQSAPPSAVSGPMPMVPLADLLIIGDGAIGVIWTQGESNAATECAPMVIRVVRQSNGSLP